MSFGFFSSLGLAYEWRTPNFQISIKAAEKGAELFQLNRHTTWIVSLLPIEKQAGEVLDFTFDARMPQHNHGMVTKAKVIKISRLEYRVEGVRFHMPGNWLLQFLIKDKTGTTRIETPLNIDNK